MHKIIRNEETETQRRKILFFTVKIFLLREYTARFEKKFIKLMYPQYPSPLLSMNYVIETKVTEQPETLVEEAPKGVGRK